MLGLSGKMKLLSLIVVLGEETIPFTLDVWYEEYPSNKEDPKLPLELPCEACK